MDAARRSVLTPPQRTTTKSTRSRRWWTSRTALPRPERLLYDKAADADWLRESLQTRGIELICPHRANRTRPATQDGRPLRRYQRPLDRRAHDQLAAQLPPADHALGVVPGAVRGLRSLGLPVHHPQTVLKLPRPMQRNYLRDLLVAFGNSCRLPSSAGLFSAVDSPIAR
ncbi:MAG: hypothetical protein KatS3mg114_0844 [Planctomycetaceae bacterium]|nr:MAG: hypothetical protein KatS3mg114_0844 [Planctomycetaceae bacterium]